VIVADYEAGSYEALVEAWLLSKGSSVWGRAFELVADDSRADAVAWWVAQLDAFEQFYLDAVGAE
jgi:hypothetical protein